MAPIMAARVGGRRNTVVAAAFQPTSLSGLALWLDAGQITGATDGAAVATWQDRSGNARNATQATAAKQAIYRSTGGQITTTGKPVVQLDGVDDFFTYGGSVTTQPYSLFFVTSMTTITSGMVFMDRPFGSGANSATYVTGATVQWNLYDGAAYATTFAPTTAHQQVTALHNSTSSQIFFNGTAGTASSAGSNDLASGLSLGQNQAGGGNWAGSIAEVLIYNRLVTSTERLQVEAYLKSKHGTP